jgi:prepilin-type N-terminal cleavage/methylation domain-containing protein
MNRKSAFTLLELLVVMGIMALLMGVSSIGFIQMRRGSEIRGAVMTVRTTMMLARQQAVTKRQNVAVYFNADAGGDNSMVVVQGTTDPVTNSIVYLPRGVMISGVPSQNPLIFTPSGGSGGVGAATIGIQEKTGAGPNRDSRTITVWLLSGVTEE